jgi:hypothetical protein
VTYVTASLDLQVHHFSVTPHSHTREWHTVPSANPVFAGTGRRDAHSGDSKYSTCHHDGQRVDCLPSCVLGGSDHETQGPQVAADQKDRGEALLPGDVSATSSCTKPGGGVVLKVAVTAGSVMNHDLFSTILREGCFHGPRGTTPVRALFSGSGNCSSFCWVSFRVVKRTLQHCVLRRSPTRATERKAWAIRRPVMVSQPGRQLQSTLA